MPEYLALVHHRNTADKPDEAPEWTPEELNDAFVRIHRRRAQAVH